MRRFWERMRVVRGCWIWQGSVSANGYGSASWSAVTWTAHRLAWHLANYRTEDVLPAHVQIRHTCDVRLCCNPEHLLIGSAAENAEDAMSRGRTNGGKPSGCSHKAVRHRIFELDDAGTPKAEIARQLGMSERNVHYHLRKRSKSSTGLLNT